jgi:hypothetical protein
VRSHQYQKTKYFLNMMSNMIKKIAFFIACALVLTRISAQIEVEYPYNPDFENDGSVGIEDVLQLLSVFESEFQPEGLLVDGVPFENWAESVTIGLGTQALLIDSLLEAGTFSVDSIWLELSNDTLFLMPFGSFVTPVGHSLVDDSHNLESGFQTEEFQITSLLPENCVNWIFRDNSAPSVLKVVGVLDGYVYYLTNELQLVKISGNSQWEYVSQHVFGSFTDSFSNNVIGTSLHEGRFFIGLSGTSIAAFGCASCNADLGCHIDKIYIHDLETNNSRLETLSTSFHFTCATWNFSGTGRYTQFRYPWIKPTPQITYPPAYQTKIVNVETMEIVSTVYNGILQENFLLGSSESLGAYVFNLDEQLLFEIPGNIPGWSVLKNDTLSRVSSPISGNENVCRIDSYLVPSFNEISSIEIVTLDGTSSPLSESIWRDKLLIKSGQYFMNGSILSAQSVLGFLVSPMASTVELECQLHQYVVGRNQNEYYGEYPLGEGAKYAAGLGNVWFNFYQ